MHRESVCAGDTLIYLPVVSIVLHCFFYVNTNIVYDKFADGIK